MTDLLIYLSISHTLYSMFKSPGNGMEKKIKPVELGSSNWKISDKALR